MEYNIRKLNREIQQEHERRLDEMRSDERHINKRLNNIRKSSHPQFSDNS